MRTQFSGIALLCLSLALSGCGKDSDSQPERQNQINHPSSVAEPELAPWAIHFQTACDSDVPPDQCQGRYGFTLRSDGFYEVGPGPEGQKFRGVLDEVEMDNFIKTVRSEVMNFSLPQKCAKEAAVTIDYGDKETTSCHNKLTGDIKKLVKQYYPEKFPNPCVDATEDLEKLYDNATSCERDEDCSYLGPDFLPIDPMEAAIPSIAVEDCTYIEPLAIANSFSAVLLQRDLLVARKRARVACASDLFKPSCSKTFSITPSRKNQFCFKHKCQLRTVR